MQLDQTQLPVLTALQAAQYPHAAFYTPGHRRGQGSPAVLTKTWGAQVWRYDLPELPGLDNLLAPSGILQEAQALAAAAYGAEQTWFLVNGSTCGVMAAILATCGPGDRILVSRNSHRSVLNGLVVSGAMPIWIEPEYDAEVGLSLGLDPAQVAAALGQYPDIKAVLMVSPTYHGICSPVAEIAAIAHQQGIPLLVDEAHGAHFAFHPDLPQSALAAGADVVIQSTHKTLAALTQAAMVHQQGDRVSSDRITQAIALLQSTSPSYLLMASLDAARHQMATQGQPLMEQTLVLAQQARQQICQIPRMAVLDSSVGKRGCSEIDLTRLTLDLAGLGLTGFKADEILHTQLGVIAEFPDYRYLTFILTLGTQPEEIHQLVRGCQQLAQHHAQPALPEIPHPQRRSGQLTIPARSPRSAYYAPAITVDWSAAVDYLSAATICPYPPGIPVVLPGERISRTVLDYLRSLQDAGGVITGCHDLSLATLQVIDPATA